MTQITSAQANKILQVALFLESQRSYSLVNMLTEEAPKNAKINGGKQTSPGAPVVRVSDLTKQRGDEVDMQIFHKLNKRPTMGDRKIAGRLENLSQAEFSLRINQTRHGVDAGGKMSQKRTKHDLRSIARTLLADGYYGSLTDQRGFVQLAGARGDYMHDDIILPLADDPDFADIMINEVMAPTYERHFFGGDATSLETLDDSDLFSLDCVDNLALFLAENGNSIQPIKLASDKDVGNPLFLLMVSPRQWNDFKVSSSGRDLTAMMAAAIERSKGLNHMIFRGEMAKWNNILIRPYPGMPIRFNPGSTVNVCTANSADATETQVTTATTVDRAVLLGGQALANAFGSGAEGSSFSMHEEKTDHGNSTEITVSWMSGLKKIRFRNKSGYMQDHGAIALDTAISTVGLR